MKSGFPVKNSLHMNISLIYFKIYTFKRVASPTLLNTHRITLFNIVLNKNYSVTLVLGQYEFKICKDTSFCMNPNERTEVKELLNVRKC